MSVEANKAQTRQIIDQGWNKGNMDALDDLISSNSVNHTASIPNETRDGFKQRVQMIRTAFPDWEMTADEMQITAKNAGRLKCRVVAEGANGPTTLQADEVLRDKGGLSDSRCPGQCGWRHCILL